MKITEGLVNFLLGTTLDRVPQEVIYRAKELMLNIIGVALAGSAHRGGAGEIVVNYVRGLAGNPQATVLGKDFKTSPINAALANATSAHTLDYDDSHFVMLGHPSASIVPAVLAFGEELGASGGNVLEAYIIGFETGIRLAEGFQVKVAKGFMSSQYLRGWHTTGTLGVIMSTAACIKLAKLSPEKAATAFGIAGSLAGGVRANLHTMTNPLHCGIAAMNGIIATSLAAQGLSATNTIFDDVYGYCDVTVGIGKIQEAKIKQALSSTTYAFIDPGFAIKIYPGATVYFAAVESTIEIVREHDIKPSQVESILCGMTRAGLDVARIQKPNTGHDAMYSISYSVAVSVMDRDLGPEQYTDDRVRDPAVHDMMGKVKIYEHPELVDTDSHDVAACQVTIKLNDGREFTKSRSRPKGSPGGEPLSHAELLDKYCRSVTPILPKDNVDQSIELIENLEAVSHIGLLTRLLSIAP